MPVAVHATTPEGMRRAILAGAATIEHGDGGTSEIFKLMVERRVALCPTLAVVDATSQYAGWKRGQQPEPPSIAQKRESFHKAIQAGVKIAYGTDAGVFPHGMNAADFRLLVELGMTPMQAIQAATLVAAELLGQSDRLGSLQPGKYADLIAVQADPLKDITLLEKIPFVMKGGVIYKNKLP